MRLLNTQTLHFKEFFGEKRPSYAILSHVWSAQELRYEDFLAGQGKDLYGHEKIVKLCELCRNFKDEMGPTPLEYCWVDTICIDKRSSAELTEAINSMYSWYENATVCFVFLPDVESRREDKQSHVAHSSGAAFYEYQFLETKWFKRGFTLQELIAPTSVLFYNTAFQIIGQKGVISTGIRPLTDLVHQASGISISSLLGRLHNNPRGACIAQKMSWASKRQTTRPEDLAYCLLGIFSVNMPLLYGEGAENAFRRLQEAIIARSTDESIFAWETDDSTQPWSGLLAPHPRVFWNCNDMYTLRSGGAVIATTYAITQRGLELTMSMDPGHDPSLTPTWCYLYPLSCFRLRKPWYKCFIKIWIEDVTMDGRKYADGFRLAWRSGLITLEYDEPPIGDEQRTRKTAQSRENEAMRQTLRWRAPDLLKFTDMEQKLYELLQQRRVGVGPMVEKKRPLHRAYEKLYTKKPTPEPSIVKLFFKTHFTTRETPIATALLQSLTKGSSQPRNRN